MTMESTTNTRREVIGRAALAAAGIAAGTAMMQSSGMLAQAQVASKTFLLIHGAWHGGWCWRRVSDLLEKRGHKVFAPTLTGLGERSHLLNEKIDLSTHIGDVVNVIKWEGLKDFVLVGHSYAGYVVTGLAERVPESIASIVFLDAFMPENGDSLAATGSERVREGIAAARQRGDLGIPPVPAAAFQVNENDRAWVDALCTPHPIGTFTEKLIHDGARERIARKAYIRAAGYSQPTFDKALATKKADPSWRTYEVPCGHDVMVDMPDRLVEILLEVA
jgi:pimeloyl-ACP methyl ester carboxylesterase